MKQPKLIEVKVIIEVDECVDLSYIDEDYKRMQQFIDGSVQSLYINAKAVVIYSIGSGCSRLETLQSGGLGGVESDSGNDYIQEIITEQLEDLKTHLRIFNVNTSNFEELTEIAKEEVEKEYTFR